MAVTFRFFGLNRRKRRPGQATIHRTFPPQRQSFTLPRLDRGILFAGVEKVRPVKPGESENQTGGWAGGAMSHAVSPAPKSL